MAKLTKTKLKKIIEQWSGLEDTLEFVDDNKTYTITVCEYIDANKQAALVQDIISRLFDETGRYMIEYRGFIFKTTILSAYTNIDISDLGGNLLNDIFYKRNANKHSIFDIVCMCISPRQLEDIQNDIESGVEVKLDEIANTQKILLEQTRAKIDNEQQQLVEKVDSLNERFQELYTQIDWDELNKAFKKANTFQSRLFNVDNE